MTVMEGFLNSALPSIPHEIEIVRLYRQIVSAATIIDPWAVAGSRFRRCLDIIDKNLPSAPLWIVYTLFHTIFPWCGLQRIQPNWDGPCGVCGCRAAASSRAHDSKGLGQIATT